MKLTILGTSAAYAPAERACSGYLVEDEAGTILVDCGPGSVSNLFAHVDPAGLDGIVISHLHFDHYLDIYPLHYFYRFDAPDGMEPKSLWAPPGARERILEPFDEDGAEHFDKTMRFETIADGASCTMGGLALTFRRVPHAVEAYAMRVSGSATLVYSSDCEYNEGLLELATGADMLLAEATWEGRETGSGSSHMTAREVGELGTAAGVGAVVATHFWPTTDRGKSAHELAAAFSGPSEIADEHLSIEV